jgi:hypothetical protein
LGAQNKDNISSAIASLDGFIIGVASKGKAFTGGGEEDGVSTQSAHSAALAWAELLRHAAIWNKADDSNGNSTSPTTPEITAAPMLIHVAVAPILAQTGIAYFHHLDSLLRQVDSGVEDLPPISIVDLARRAVATIDNAFLNSREKAHLKALDCLMRQDHRRAMMVLYRHLQVCPGDALALSLLLDVAHTVGDAEVALRGASAVAAYWNERRGGIIRPSIPGYNTTMAMIALGLAVGGRRAEAETMATTVRSKGEKLAGGISTWALAHVLDAEGRTAEGISACANTDGIVHYEACGFLLFDAMLSGYGVRFALDREERGRGRSAALRLYDNNYESLLDYSGFSQGLLHDKPYRRAPIGWKRSKFEESRRTKAFMANIFGQTSSFQASQGPNASQFGSVSSETILATNNTSSISSSVQRPEWKPTIEDVLTWLPPTPQFLCDATLLLLRLTLNGTISCQNYRWENIRNAWSALFEMNNRYNKKVQNDHKDVISLDFYPLVCVAASLIADPSLFGKLSGAGGRLATGLHKMGELLGLGDITIATDTERQENEESNNLLSTILFRDIVADKDPDFWLPVKEETKLEEWRTVLKLLSSAINGVYDPTGEDDHDIMKAEISSGFKAWEFDVRPFLEHAVVYAACKCGDYESLSIARSICSRGVTLRPNSPEEWWRYSIVLGLLGDEVASEDALNASHSFGGGQGARRDD